MASLYRRATASQALMLRIIEGAIKNAGDVHPTIQVSATGRRSIAKRAVGTLTAQWPEVLARGSLPVSDAGGITTRQPARGFARGNRAGQRGPGARLPTPGLRHLRKALTQSMWRVARHEHAEYRRAMIDVLRTIAQLTGEGIR